MTALLLRILLIIGAAVGVAVLAVTFIDTNRQDDPRFAPRAVPRKPPVVLPSGPVRFTDITKASGIHFVANNGAFGAEWIPETLGTGVAFIDYDNDGYPDLFFVNGRNWTDAEIAAYKNGPGKKHFAEHGFVLPPNKPYQRTTCALYHNNGDGTFTDVTHGSGLDIEMYGMGVAVGDYDNDGRPDLLVTALDRLYLFHNESTPGHPHFREVAGALGLRSHGWFTGAAFVDYDRDGRLDVFACRYVHWNPTEETTFTSYHIGNQPQEHRGSSGPNSYDPDSDALFHNLGPAGFQDVSRAAGIEGKVARAGPGAKGPGGATFRKLQSNGLSVAVCDINHDGWPDFLVGNDFQRNFLFQNNRDGTFSEVAVQSGVAYANNGSTRSAMGMDTVDLDGTGGESILIGNFTHQQMGLYQVSGQSGNNVLYRDVAQAYGVDKPSNWFVTFGCAFVDIDNDGHPDIFATNGHVQDDVEINFGYSDYGQVTVAQRPLLFWNKWPKRAFQEIGFGGGKPQPEMIGRGLACADFDLDGDEDVVITTLNGPPMLLRNDGGNKNNSLRLVLEGTKSNRSAIGAEVEAKVNHNTLRRTVKSGSSYLSQSELPITLGMGQAASVSSLTISWPSGLTTHLSNLAANQILTIREGQGIVRQQKFRRQNKGL